jgi:hypothetical protein
VVADRDARRLCQLQAQQVLGAGGQEEAAGVGRGLQLGLDQVGADPLARGGVVPRVAAGCRRDRLDDRQEDAWRVFLGGWQREVGGGRSSDDTLVPSNPLFCP